MLFKARTTQTIFEAMSYSYRFAFIEHLLSTKHDLIEEINQLALQDQNNGSSSMNNDSNMGNIAGDTEEFLFNKKNSL